MRYLIKYMFTINNVFIYKLYKVINWKYYFLSFNRIDFPREVVRGETLFTNLIIDETTASPENHCDDVFIYISDTVEPGIIN